MDRMGVQEDGSLMTQNVQLIGIRVQQSVCDMYILTTER